MMAQCHDAIAVQFLIEQQVVGKAPEVGTPPSARIKEETLGMGIHFIADPLEFRPEVIAQRMADRVIMPERRGNVAPDPWMEPRHQR